MTIDLQEFHSMWFENADKRKYHVRGRAVRIRPRDHFPRISIFNIAVKLNCLTSAYAGRLVGLSSLNADAQIAVMCGAETQPNSYEQRTSLPRVLHVLDHSWPVLSGYGVRSRNLITAQHRLNYPIRVVTGPLHQLDDPTAADVTVDGVSYKRTPIVGNLGNRALRRRWPIAREYAAVRLLRQEILRIIAHEDVQLVHAHSPALCGLAALQAARKAGLPCIYEIRAFWEDAAADRNNNVRNWRSHLTHGLETYVAKKADAVSAIAKPMLGDLQSRGIPARKLFHTPNGVDTDRFVPAAKDIELARELKLEGTLVFGFFGSLYRYEGVSWLIRALARLRASGQNFQVLVIGRGEDDNGIRKAIQDHTAGSYVHLIEYVPHERIGRYYSVLDIAVYPRRSIRLTELVTPLKPLEAMAVGKPVLASDVGGIRELVENEVTGLLFRPEDEEDFCRQGARLVTSPSLRGRLAAEGRDFVVRERDWKVLAKRYADIYRFAQSCRAEYGT
jgi:PEP-CTERM/exosortase A-associated glycosyltransferase